MVPPVVAALLFMGFWIGTLEAEGPPPQVPFGGGAPGLWPGSTTTCLFSVDTTGGLKVDIEAQGPTPWSLPRYNNGDFAARLAPGRPFSMHNLGPQGGQTEEDPGASSTQAWRPRPEYGLLLPTVRRDGAPAEGGSTWFGVAAVCCCCSNGAGYDMEDGTWKPRGAPLSMDVIIGRAGVRGEGADDGHAAEGSIDFAATWLPFSAGWVGGWVAAPIFQPGSVTADGAWVREASEGAPGSHSPVLGTARDVVSWTRLSGSGGAQAHIRLPADVSALGPGMLFVVPINDGNAVNTVTASIRVDGRGSSWMIQLREAYEVSDDRLATDNESDFEWLFVPFSVPRLIGGHVLQDGSVPVARGDFSAARAGPGVYLLTIAGKGARDGTLLLQVAGTAEAAPTLTARAIIAYEAVAQGDMVGTLACPADACFKVVTRHAAVGAEGVRFEMTDADFFFMWVDITDPAEPRTTLPPPPPLQPGPAPVPQGDSAPCQVTTNVRLLWGTLGMALAVVGYVAVHSCEPLFNRCGFSVAGVIQRLLARVRGEEPPSMGMELTAPGKGGFF